MLLESMEPNEAYALYILNNLNSNKIVELANTWILTGLFTDSLNDLCWEKDLDMYVVAPMFEKLMEELNISPLTRLEAAKLIIEIILTKIIHKEIEPEVGGSFIYNYVWGEVEGEYPVIKYVGDSLGLEHIFCWLREIWDCRDGSKILYYTDLPRNQAVKKFEEHLIEEAQNWLVK
jgi:hypothetical protein